MRRIIFFTTLGLIIVLTLVGYWVDYRRHHIAKPPAPAVITTPLPGASAPTVTPAPAPTPTPPNQWNSPLGEAKARVTKKFFGTYVTPQNSPVMPERFTGYHTGWDFETTAAEANADVTVNAFCAGPLKLKEWASGYGGVAVQGCTLGGQAVTVIYGHLNIDTVTVGVGSQLGIGDKIGLLGAANSHQTDGERKHLHFAIHKGTSINIKGYVQNKADLSDWADPATYLGAL